MSRCEDERMWSWDVKMRRCFTDPHYWKNPALRRSREQTSNVPSNDDSHMQRVPSKRWRQWWWERRWRWWRWWWWWWLMMICIQSIQFFVAEWSGAQKLGHTKKRHAFHIVFVHTFFCRNACGQGYFLREGLCTQTRMLLNTGACAQKSLHTYTHMILHRRPCTHRKFLHTEVPLPHGKFWCTESFDAQQHLHTES